jgi:hypothetical protein
MLLFCWQFLVLFRLFVVVTGARGSLRLLSILSHLYVRFLCPLEL